MTQQLSFPAEHSTFQSNAHYLGQAYGMGSRRTAGTMTQWHTAQVDLDQVSAMTVETVTEIHGVNMFTGLGKGCGVDALTLHMQDGSDVDLWVLVEGSADGVMVDVFGSRQAAITYYNDLVS